jgi:tetratricopeptide (TPR) repeat protein
MTPDQWQQISLLFAQCLETAPANRSKLLADCKASDEVQLEVRRLLKSLDEADPNVLGNIKGDSATEHRLREGDVLSNRFRILRFLGSGGMGEVYEAADLDVGGPVALKVVRSSSRDVPGVSARLKRELLLARSITHPNVCRLFDLNRHVLPWGEIEFITMELLRGSTLADIMKQRGPLQTREALPYLRQILAGLQAAHEAGIVHRDLKPANIMVTETPDRNLRCVVMDFGLAKQSIVVAAGDSFTRSREIIGTLAYMAPEQVAGTDISVRTDLYAIGIIMFELLHGQSPFLDRTRSDGSPNVDRKAGRASKVAPDIPKPWAEIIQSCLNPDPSRRPSSAQQIAAAIERKVVFTRRIMIAGGLAIATAAAVSEGWYVYLRDARPRFERGAKLLVASPLIAEGDPIGVQVQASLRQSNQLTLWENARTSEVWQRMGRAGSPAPSTRDWREIALRESVDFVLFPSAVRVGDGFSLSLRLEHLKGDPSAAAATWQKSFEAVDGDSIFQAVDAGSRWIRDLVGESANEITESSVAPQKVTTPSWDALKEFSRGEALMTQRDPQAAILAYSAATRLDPQFTMAWMRLGDVQVSLGRDNDAFTAWRRAEEASRERRLTRREDLRFRGMLASDSANYALAEKLFKEYAFYFPSDSYGPFYRALPLLLMGQVGESTKEMEKCLSFPRAEPSACLQLVIHYLYAGNVTAAESMVARLKKLQSTARAAFCEAVIAHYRADTDTAVDALKRAATDKALLPRSKQMLSTAIVLADGGRIGDAIDTLRISAQEDDAMGERERWAAKLTGLAFLLDMNGDRLGAINATAPLQRVEAGPTYIGWAGMLFARFGDAVQARRMLATIAPGLDYPRFQAPRLRIQAELQFAEGNRLGGLSLARKAATFEPKAFGSEYLAASLERFASRQEALAEWRDCLRAKCFQLFLAAPLPVGSWYRASTAVRRLESST